MPLVNLNQDETEDFLWASIRGARRLITSGVGGKAYVHDVKAAASLLRIAEIHFFGEEVGKIEICELLE